MRKIRIKNFRSLVMEEPIEIKPITLLFGKNGSGKSSFLKAIKFLGNNLFPLDLGQTKYKLYHDIDLGDFKQIVFQHKIKNKISIDFEEYWEKNSDIINYKINTLIEDNEEGKNLSTINIIDIDLGIAFDIYPREKNQYDENFIEKNFGFRKYSREELKLLFEKFDDESVVGFSTYPLNGLEINRNIKSGKPEFEKFFKYLDVLPFFNKHEDLRFSYYKRLAQKLGFSEEQEKVIEFLVNYFVIKLPKQAQKFFNHWYVTPLREKPKSKFELLGNKFNPKDYYGIPNQVDTIFQRDNKYYPGKDSNILHFINKSLSDLGLGQEFLIDKDKGYGSIFIKDLNGVKHNLAESSSGLIQTLPIVVASYNALYQYGDHVRFSRGDDFTDVIIIEQPELHLHPALQTKVVDFISKGMGLYIIETHSEHIVRKIQVLIARGDLPKEKVAVYYFDKNKTTGITSIKEMELEDNGFFKEPWPDGFFDDSYNLARELIYARKN